jgi:hypothetical protein
MAGAPGPGGETRAAQQRQNGVPGTPGGSVQQQPNSPGADAAAAGGTGLGASATASDTRTGTGTSSGSATVTGGDPAGGNTGSAADKGSGRA